ncbi:MAG: ATP-binding cassette domain-containing protein [Synergistaceae bacterium]|nr:ATP-binding cassette domain-containing protein [Synergistaceae bacterium]
MLTEKTTKRSNTPLIEVRSVSYSYSAKSTGRALNRVSFFVDRGERVAILGHNGSGKSTLVKILGGLQDANEGECLINGVNIQDMEFRELRQTIGMVFQDPENQIVAAMVEDDIAFAPENQGLPSHEIQARVDKALARVNMLHKRENSVSALSGGEKQRIALAGALAAKVDCLILDEATAMLDPKGRVDIERTLRKIHSDGMTIIQVTHQIEAENFDDIQRVIVLGHGEIIWQGSTQEFWDKAEDLGFELPEEFKARRYFEAHNINFPDDFANIKVNARVHEVSHKAGAEKFRLEDLSFRYDEKNYALRKINASFYSGQWLSIIGRTGSGKSTLVQHLNALYKIQEGNIYFDGENLPQKGEEVHKLRQKVGLVFQHPEDQLFSANVKEELAFAPKNAGFKGFELDEAILYGLQCVSLDEKFLTRNPIALSGGERRLVAIASVLSARPECVVLDEPLAGLDASYQRKILAMLGKLRDEGKTIITITHDLKTAFNYSDKILILRDGGFVKAGSPREVLDELMNVLEPEAWPDILRLSVEIRRVNPNFPLLYDYQEFISCISQM